MCVSYPVTDGDLSTYTWLSCHIVPRICHSVYARVLRYDLPVRPKKKDRDEDIPARGINTQSEPAMVHVLTARLKVREEIRQQQQRSPLQTSHHSGVVSRLLVAAAVGSLYRLPRGAALRMEGTLKVPQRAAETGP